jgi:hypothetical protein
MFVLPVTTGIELIKPPPKKPIKKETTHNDQNEEQNIQPTQTMVITKEVKCKIRMRGIRTLIKNK